MRTHLTGVLAPLEPHRRHHLYPRMSSEVLMTERREGTEAARRHAQRIARVISQLEA